MKKKLKIAHDHVDYVVDLSYGPMKLTVEIPFTMTTNGKRYKKKYRQTYQMDADDFIAWAQSKK